MRRAEHEGQASQVPRGVGASGDRVVATPRRTRGSMGPAAGNPRHMVPQGASPASTPPRVENGSVRRGLPSRPRGRRPAGRQAPGHGSARPTAQRASSRPGAAVPKDHGVRTPSRRLAARICHSTERSIVGITTIGSSSMLPTRAGCQHHQPERVSGRARAHMCVCSARLGPRTCERARAAGIITQPLSPST